MILYFKSRGTLFQVGVKVETGKEMELCSSMWYIVDSEYVIYCRNVYRGGGVLW